MLEKDTMITLDNNKNYTVLRTIEYNNNQYALITDFNGEDYVVFVEKEDGEITISLIEDEKEEEIIINKFLKDSLEELKSFQENN